MTYSWADKLGQGLSGEQKLDNCFRLRFIIEEGDQSKGYDRVFTGKESGTQIKVEYKTDTVAHETGNMFVETASVIKDDRVIKEGWPLTTEADWIVYYTPGDETIRWIKTDTLRGLIPSFVSRFKPVRVATKGKGDYQTEGIPVPFSEIPIGRMESMPPAQIVRNLAPSRYCQGCRRNIGPYAPLIPVEGKESEILEEEFTCPFCGKVYQPKSQVWGFTLYPHPWPPEPKGGRGDTAKGSGGLTEVKYARRRKR